MKFLFFFLFCLQPFTTVVFCIDPAPAKIKLEDLPADIQGIVDKIDERNQNLVSLQASFVQKKVLSLLSEPMSLKGKFFLKKGVGMKFEFAPPENMEIYFTDRKIVSISHNERTVSTKKIPRRKSDLTQVLLSERIDKVLEYFSISRIEGEEEGDTALLLLPEKRKMKKRFKEIRIFLTKDYLIRKISVIDNEGDYLEVVLKDQVVNEALEDSVFEAETPEGYQTGTSLDPIFGTQVGL